MREDLIKLMIGCFFIGAISGGLVAMQLTKWYFMKNIKDFFEKH